jgi:uncharacterized phage-associated protein
LTIVSRCQQLIFAEPRQAWQRQPVNSEWYNEFMALGRKSQLELLTISAKLEKDKEKLETLLYDLVHFASYELANNQMARIILESLRQLKRRANARLALDLMVLKLAQVGGK